MSHSQNRSSFRQTYLERYLFIGQKQTLFDYRFWRNSTLMDLLTGSTNVFHIVQPLFRSVIVTILFQWSKKGCLKNHSKLPLSSCVSRSETAFCYLSNTPFFLSALMWIWSIWFRMSSCVQLPSSVFLPRMYIVNWYFSFISRVTKNNIFPARLRLW